MRIVGMMPERFSGFAIGADVWMPIQMMARIEPSARWTERLAVAVGNGDRANGAGNAHRALDRSLVAALPLINYDRDRSLRRRQRAIAASASRRSPKRDGIRS